MNREFKFSVKKLGEGRYAVELPLVACDGTPVYAFVREGCGMVTVSDAGDFFMVAHRCAIEEDSPELAEIAETIRKYSEDDFSLLVRDKDRVVALEKFIRACIEVNAKICEVSGRGREVVS